MSRRVAISDVASCAEVSAWPARCPPIRPSGCSATERLLRERAEIEAAVARLTDPWTDVRGILNDLAAVVNRTTH